LALIAALAVGVAASAALLGACGDGGASDESDGESEEDALGAADRAGLAAPCQFDFQCDDQNACTQNKCDLGQCQFPPGLDGIPCDDGDSCTRGDVCKSGMCIPAAIESCPDPNPGDCQAVTCGPLGGCLPVLRPLGSPCTTGEPCVVGSTCDLFGNCQGGVKDPGCRDAGVPDAAVVIDAGGSADAPGPSDASDPMTGDASLPPLDAPPGDGPSPPADAKIQTADGSLPGPDAAQAPPDAAQAPPDAAQAPDATAGLDAGGPVSDAAFFPDGPIQVDVRGGGGCAAVDPGPGRGRHILFAWLAGVFAALATRAARRRRRARSPSRAALVAGLLLLVGVGGAGRAYAQVPANARVERLDLGLFQPASGAAPYLMSEGATLLGERHLAFGVFVDYADAPLIARVQRDAVVSEVPIVDSMVRLDLSARVGVVDVVEVGAVVPLVSSQGGGVVGLGTPPGGSFALGDITLVGKLALHRDDGDSFAAAIAFGIGAPVGDEAVWGSSGAWVFRPAATVDIARRRFAVAGSAGFILRSQAAVLIDLDVQHELELGAAGRYRVGSAPLFALAEVHFRVGLGGGAAGTPGEALLGAGVRVDSGLELVAAVGRGLTDGYGAPALRVVFGLRLGFGEPD
jgi:hypothetical protein